jgi:hypothetical protein
MSSSTAKTLSALTRSEGGSNDASCNSRSGRCSVGGAAQAASQQEIDTAIQILMFHLHDWLRLRNQATNFIRTTANASPTISG